MGKRVLVAVDRHSASEASIVYGIELAARIEAPLSLIVISSSKSHEKSTGGTFFSAARDIGHDERLDRLVAESRQKGMDIEVFTASGRFWEKLIRFVRSQLAVHFIVMAPPEERFGKHAPKFTSALKELHEAFEGEILLVEKAGQVSRFSDLYVQSSMRENSV